jgi:hypothetical protein
MELYDFLEKWNEYIQMLNAQYAASCILYEEAEESGNELESIVNNLWTYNNTVNREYIDRSVYSDMEYVRSLSVGREEAVFENAVHNHDYTNMLLEQVRDCESSVCSGYEKMISEENSVYRDFTAGMTAVDYVPVGCDYLRTMPLLMQLPLQKNSLNTQTTYTDAISDSVDINNMLFDEVLALSEESTENKLYTYALGTENYKLYERAAAVAEDTESRIYQIQSLAMSERISEDRYERMQRLFGDRLSEVCASDTEVNASEYIAESRLFNSIAERDSYAEHIFSEERGSDSILSENILHELSEREYTSKERGNCVINVDFKAYATVKNDRDVEKLADVFVNRLKAELASGAEGIHY